MEQQSQEEYIKMLENSKPLREVFKSQEEFEEALGYWMSHQGRIIALHRSKTSQQTSSLKENP